LKAILLAAGLGTRLRPLTDTVPKCLVPVQGSPLLGIWLGLLHRYAIDQVLVNTNAHSAVVRDYLARHANGLSIRIFEEPELLGSAGTLAANRDWVRQEPFFWVFYADVLTNARLDRMLVFHHHHPSAATLGVYEVSDPKRCGIAVTDAEGRITEFVEKPSNPRSQLAFSGLLIGTPAFLDSLPTSFPSDLGFDVFPRLAGRMFAYPISEYLIDIGTQENYRLAQANWPGI
jgi:mannose-1-phosphate guanylyltransferase